MSELLKPLLQIFDLFSRKKKKKDVRKNCLFFSRSSQYWNDRYVLGGNSGSGSYGRLATFKAEVINEFVKVHGIDSVVEYGCGDGAQLSLATYSNYKGFDVSPAAVEMCREQFKKNDSYEFFETKDKISMEGNFDLALSLDVIYHLVEDEVFEKYMARLFSASHKFVVIYSSNVDSESVARHEKRRNFMEWVEKNALDWHWVDTIYNKFPYDKKDPANTSLSDFFVFEKKDEVNDML